MIKWIKPNNFPLFLAPMARYTDVVFRGLCKEQGADVMLTEFVHADAILIGKTDFGRPDFTEEQRPMGVQIFGSNINNMAEASKNSSKINPDFIDINCGCPANRVQPV